MIRQEEITEIGRFNKPHGIKGEISATIDEDIDIDSMRCIFTDIDGIIVPFFIDSWRPKTASTVLLTLAGVADERQAADFTNLPVYALRSEVHSVNEEEQDGAYASDFIGFTVQDTDGKILGEITDIEDSTQNMLFIVRTPADTTLYLPIAEEFISGIDMQNKTIGMSLPQGITDL